jgi:hypothetical protein
MLSRIAADLVLVVHFAFIAFVVLGGLLVIRHHWLAWVHVPAAAWGAWVEISGRICPLTTLENALRLEAGLDGYRDSFVEHHLLPVIYPGELTRTIQLALAALVVLVNAGLYGYLLLRRPKTRINEPRSSR